VQPGLEAAHLASMQALYAHHVMMMLQAASATMGHQLPDALMYQQQHPGPYAMTPPAMQQQQQQQQHPLSNQRGRMSHAGGGGGHAKMAGEGAMGYGTGSGKMNGMHSPHNLAASSLSAAGLHGLAQPAHSALQPMAPGGAGMGGERPPERGRNKGGGIDVSKLLSIDQVGCC